MTTVNQPLPLIHVAARRWFDGLSTYHSVCVTLPDGAQLFDAFAYGHGDHYLQTAAEVMGFGCSSTMGEHFRVVTDVCDVARRRDLHNGGRHV